MERQLWKAILALIASLCKSIRSPWKKYQDADIVATFYWAVIHDRPVSWACDRRNWSGFYRKQVPSQSRMSERMRTESVIALLNEIERRVLRPDSSSLYWTIDGKPLVIGGCSKDRQAGYGRAASGKAKGYKLHTIINDAQNTVLWRVAPMNVDERKMAERMLRTAPIQGYITADSNYDSNPLHEICDKRGNLQLVAPRRYGPQCGHGHRKQTPGRMRSKELLENPTPEFGQALLKNRNHIERFLGNLTNWGGGLTCLPAWVRTHRRVRLWVQAKLILYMLKRQIK